MFHMHYSFGKIVFALLLVIYGLGLVSQFCICACLTGSHGSRILATGPPTGIFTLAYDVQCHGLHNAQ